MSTLVTGAGVNFVYLNGAQPDNVVWAVGTAATLGANTVVPGIHIPRLNPKIQTFKPEHLNPQP
jgi:hypothetical protein